MKTYKGVPVDYLLLMVGGYISKEKNKNLFKEFNFDKLKNASETIENYVISNIDDMPKHQLDMAQHTIDLINEVSKK